jgi:hypothetical protein
VSWEIEMAAVSGLSPAALRRDNGAAVMDSLCPAPRLMDEVAER